MLVLFEMREGSPRYDATHAMPNEINDNILLFIFLHVVTDVVFYFLCNLLAHYSDITFGIVLV